MAALKLVTRRFAFLSTGHVARMGEKRGAYLVVVVKTEEKRPLGRSGLRWKDNIKIDLQEINEAWTELV